MATMMLPYGAWSVVTAVVLGILLLLKLLRSSNRKNLPPGPRGLPLIGTLHLLGKHPHWDLVKLAETYGPVMSIWLGPRLAVVASSPAAAQEILKTQGHNFSNRPKSLYADIVFPGVQAGHLISDIVLESEKPVRTHLKKLLRIQLSSSKELQQTTHVRAEEIVHLLRIMPYDGATVVNVKTYIEVVVVNIFYRMIMKKRFITTAFDKNHYEHELEQVKEIQAIMVESAKLGLAINPQDFIPFLKWIDFQGFQTRFRNLRAHMDAFMSTIISEHVEQRKSSSIFEKDMVHILLDQMEDETLRFDIINVNVISTLWEGLQAGTSTTIDTIEWAMAECIRNPIVMKKAQTELDIVVGKSRRVEDSDVPNLKYLQAIIKETLRLHLPVPMLVPHESKNACKVFGYDIPKKTMVFINVRAIGRDPKIWKDPMGFNLERFLDGMPHANINAEGKYFEFLPFGAGRRQCPGIELATTLMHILIATLLQSFDWSLPNGLQPIELDMTEVDGNLHSKAHPLSTIPKARLSISSIVNQ